MNENVMDKVVALAKRRGFVFPGSSIYGGLANSWDYGPLGVELKNNVKKMWWHHYVHLRDDMVGLDAAILMHPKTWEASGHVAVFADPLVDCKNCKMRWRADKLLEEKLGVEKVAGKSLEQLSKMIKEEAIACPNCGHKNFTDIRNFNLMFKTFQGVTEDSESMLYLRPETAQGIFVNFKNIMDVYRKRLPFGIAQVGKAFRNEITPGNFTFRTREFEQMEIEYFFNPENADWKKLYEDLKNESWAFIGKLGIKKDNLRLRDHEKDELSHYSRGTTDIEYNFPFGWGELCAAVAYRTDYDLGQHQKFSGVDLTVLDEETGKNFIPHVMEPSFGADRLTLTVLIDAYSEEEVNGQKRVVLKFTPKVAPVKVAVFPLLKNKEELVKAANEVYSGLKKEIDGLVEFDDRGNIGKRYFAQDEIGTPFCVTVDFQTLEDKTVTVRERDSMKQERVKIEDLSQYLKEKLV